ncbi:hypothetical protein EDB85DRAFT_1893104 [Lactarius pseudohatsudake]|nr:hypothetical protein EDB85DRAFT_1893104 [Lactarius pseudohatsudake]
MLKATEEKRRFPLWSKCWTLHELLRQSSYVPAQAKLPSTSFRLRCDGESCCLVRAGLENHQNGYTPDSEELLAFRPLLVFQVTKATYPYWREHQIERGSHHIIPTLNQELATAAEFVTSVLKCKQLKHEAAQQAKAGLEQGSPFPPFSKYQDTFSNKLTPDMFAAFAVPLWIPQPQQLLRFAKPTYPYWKER